MLSGRENKEKQINDTASFNTLPVRSATQPCFSSLRQNRDAESKETDCTEWRGIF